MPVLTLSNNDDRLVDRVLLPEGVAEVGVAGTAFGRVGVEQFTGGHVLLRAAAAVSRVLVQSIAALLVGHSWHPSHPVDLDCGLARVGAQQLGRSIKRLDRFCKENPERKAIKNSWSLQTGDICNIVLVRLSMNRVH